MTLWRHDTGVTRVLAGTDAFHVLADELPQLGMDADLNDLGDVNLSQAFLRRAAPP